MEPLWSFHVIKSSKKRVCSRRKKHLSVSILREKANEVDEEHVFTLRIFVCMEGSRAAPPDHSGGEEGIRLDDTTVETK